VFRTISHKNSDYFLEPHLPVALCNVDCDCLLYGRNGIFKYLLHEIHMHYG
jgi:hypothetical protein